MNQGQPTVCPAGTGAPAPLAAGSGQIDPYALISDTIRQLETSKTDINTVLRLCQGYVTVGLMGPAGELLAQLGGSIEASAEWTQLRDVIAKAPSGQIPWETLAHRFETNLARIYHAHPHLREHDQALRAVSKEHELFQTRDRNYHLALRHPDGGREWIDGLCDANRVVRDANLPHPPSALFCGPYLVAGDRLGTLFERVFEGTDKMFLSFSPRIFLLDTDPSAFGATLYATSNIESLCHHRVSIYLGRNCAEELAVHLEENPEQCTPEYTVCLTQRGKILSDAAATALQPLAAKREQGIANTLQRIQTHYGPLGPAHFAHRLLECDSKPLRVLGLTSRFTTYLQYSMRDWGAAFEQSGHEFRVLLEDNDHDLLPRARTAEVIDEYHPDLIVVIDHLRYEYGPVIPTNLPFVCWIQDLLPNLTNQEAGRSLGPIDFFIAPDPAKYVHDYGYPSSQGMPWTMATDCRTYSAMPLSKEELDPYRCDFSYVSNQSQDPRVFHDERREWFTGDPAASQLTVALFDAMERSFIEQPSIAGTAVSSLYLAVKEKTGLVPATPELDQSVLHNYLYPLAERMFRQTTLGWVADYCERTGRSLRLYGNGWSDHPRLAKYDRGFAQNGSELRAIYQASSINLQIIGTGSVHQRLLDGVAAGGFFLIRKGPADVSHEPVKKMLAAYRKYDLELDKAYDPQDVPEFADAINDHLRLYGDEKQCTSCRMTPLALDNYLDMESNGYSKCAAAIFDSYADVAFDSEKGFARFADLYLGNASRRSELSSTMRSTVVERFTYAALVKELLERMGQQLAKIPTTAQEQRHAPV